MGNRFDKQSDASKSADTSEALPNLTEPANGDRAPSPRRGDSRQVDPNTETLSSSQAYLLDARARIKAFVQDLSKAGNCDTNIVITGPVRVGVDRLCQEFQMLTEKKFQLAGSKSGMTEASSNAIGLIREQRAKAMQELIKRFGDLGYNTPLGDGSPLTQSRSAQQLSGSRKGSRISGPPVPIPEHGSHSPGSTLRGASEQLMSHSASQAAAAVMVAQEVFTSSPMLNMLHCELRLQDEYLRAMRMSERRTAASNKGAPRMRIFNGSVLDMVNIPIIANHGFPVLDDWSISTLEDAGNMAWRKFTEHCPTANTLFVYLHFDNERYQTMYNAARGPLSAGDPDKLVLDRMEPLWRSHKQAADALYQAGVPSTVTDHYFVMVVNCQNMAMSHPCVLASIVEQVLTTVVGLRDQEVPVWGPGAATEARSEFIRNPCWRTQRFAVVPENLIGNETLVSAIARNAQAATPPVERRLGRRLSGEIPVQRHSPLARPRRPSLDGAFGSRTTREVNA